MSYASVILCGMWLATKHGFYSIIQKEQGVYYVRARVRRDLENLLQVCGLDSEVHVWPTADYRYRIVVNQQSFLVIMMKLSTTLDYPNFKGRIEQVEDQRNKLGAYHQIWATMANFQSEEAAT